MRFYGFTQTVEDSAGRMSAAISPVSVFSACRKALPENGYTYEIPTDDYPLPLTVFRPFFRNLHSQTITAGETVSFTVEARNPANGVPIFQDAPETSNLSDADGLVFGTDALPEGAHFDAETRLFTFTPEKPGTYPITFTLDDGIIPVHRNVTFTAEPGTR